MLGSAIPKRWVVSLALVGLVSLFMASYAAVWANPASATTGTTTTVGATPTATSTPVPTATPVPADKLAGVVFQISSIEYGPASDITMVSGSTVQFAFAAKGGDGNFKSNMPNITETVTSSSPTCVNAQNDGFPASGYTSNGAWDLKAVGSGCQSTITVELRQGGVNPHQVSFVAKVNAVDSSATSSQTFDSTTTEDFTGTITPPTGVVASSVIPITPKNGGTLTVPATGGGSISLSVPGGAVGCG